MAGSERMRTAVLISGRGSNMQALVAAQRPNASFEISLVLSNRPAAGGLVYAREAGIPTAVLDHKAYDSRLDFDTALDETLRDAGIELVCLAGFMRILSPWFVERWHDRLLNIHPSLLPAFKGLNTHEQALAAGVRLHGCSVHLVRAELDDGPILVQGVVPVKQDDTVDTLRRSRTRGRASLLPAGTRADGVGPRTNRRRARDDRGGDELRRQPHLVVRL